MAVESPDFPDRREHRVRVGKLTLHATDWGGHASDDCIFFAHPTGFLGAVWKPLLKRLRGLGVTSRLVTFDQRGHGLSSKPDKGYEWENFVTDAAGVLHELEIRNALGVGHSAGATTLAGVAAAEPDLLRRLVLVDPVLIYPEFARLTEQAGENPMATRTRTRRMVWPSREALFRSYRHREPYDAWTDEALHAYVDEGTFERPDGEIELLCPARAEAQVYSMSGGYNAFRMLGDVKVPILLLRGENSTTLDDGRARRAAETAPNCRVMTIEGTGHFIPMEKPDEIASLVVAEHGAEA